MKRTLFQLGSLLISNLYFASFYTKNIYQGWAKGTCIPFMNCYGCPLAVVSCPIGSLQHFVIIKAIPFFLLGFFGIVGSAVGRMACGWVCPFGFFQELLYKVKTRKIYPPKILNYLKYPVLVILTLLIAYWLGEPWFCKLCPVGTLEASIPLVIWNPPGGIFSQGGTIITKLEFLFYIKLAILLGFVAVNFFIKRPFCRYACPLGAIYSLFNKFSFYRLEVNAKNCTYCNYCLKDCPMDLAVYEELNDADCIRCLKCTKCPEVNLKTIFEN